MISDAEMIETNMHCKMKILAAKIEKNLDKIDSILKNVDFFKMSDLDFNFCHDEK